jgi:hypothetical protein
MTAASTYTFGQFKLLVETTPGSGVFNTLCGLTTRGVDRTVNMQRTEIPDCDNEDLPATIERAPQSIEVAISGTGVLAKQSEKTFLDWLNNGTRLNIRLKRIGATSGQCDYEAGAAYLTKYSNTAEKGAKVTAEISLEIDGAFTPVYVP